MMPFIFSVLKKPQEYAKPGENSFRQEIKKHRRVRMPRIIYSVPHLSDIPAANNDIEKSTLKMLINEVQTLKTRCDMLEKRVEDLEGRCESHEALLERDRLEILKAHASRGPIDTEYNGERFDLM
jgi:hypothetical protein